MSIGRQTQIYQGRHPGGGAREARDLIADALAETRNERVTALVESHKQALREGRVLVGLDPMTEEEEGALDLLPLRGIETPLTLWTHGATRLLALRLLALQFDTTPLGVVEVWGRELMLGTLLRLTPDGTYALRG